MSLRGAKRRGNPLKSAPSLTLPHRRGNRKAAFTLAETLITLGIIGVVAVLTIAPLVQKYRIKQLEIAFKKTNSLIEQAMLKTSNEFGLKNFFDLQNICGYSNPDIPGSEEKYKQCVIDTYENSISQINDYFLSNFNIIERYQDINKCSKKFGIRNFTEPKTYSNVYYGNATGYCSLYGGPSWPYGSINILNDGSVITGISYLAHGPYDGISIVFDTNGPNKGPNRFGFDIFLYNTGTWLDNLCTSNSSNGYNGRGCYKYARKNQNPDDDTKGYWESLKF